tara:strand:+ start:652 stop:1215 length:564 start_codon:yes stop_codon:yes gene_type:complete
MSINHILKETVPDDEKLDVKFGIVECDEIIFDNDITGNYYGSVSPSTIGENFSSDLVLTNPIANMCNRIGDAFNVAYSGRATMSSPNAFATFSITAPYPTKIREFIATGGGVININTLFTDGSAHISTQTTDEKGHHFYVSSSEPAPGLEETHIKVNFASMGKVPATTGGFALEWRFLHNSAGNPPL